jgi:ABC-type transporter Mla subunit MlaD
MVTTQLTEDQAHELTRKNLKVIVDKFDHQSHSLYRALMGLKRVVEVLDTQPSIDALTSLGERIEHLGAMLVSQVRDEQERLEAFYAQLERVGDA